MSNDVFSIELLERVVRLLKEDTTHWDGLSEYERWQIRGHTTAASLTKGNTMASNALGSNQPDIIVQQEIFGVESDGGNDSMTLAPRATDHVGVEMQGMSMGIDVADIMQGMASQDPFPQGPGIGVESGDGVTQNDQSSSAGYHMVTTDLGGNGFVGSGVPDTGSAPAPIGGNQNAGSSDLDNDND